MKLSTIEQEPIKSLSFMERYVNDGSPSGFSFTHTSSPKTEPRGLTSGFPLLEVLPKSNVVVHNLGSLPLSLFSAKSQNESILIHPDMKNDVNLHFLCGETAKQTDFLVQPTASPRTLELINNASRGYVKLHYENHLGRIKRRLTLKHAQSALENTKILDYLISNNLMPESFSYYPETGARVYESVNQGEIVYWGMVWRQFEIRGNKSDQIAYQIPGFSLFSRDMLNPTDPIILSQIGDIHGDQKIEFLINSMLLPLIKIYFEMLLNGGLQGEWHAQNVVFGFDKNWNCISIALRDMESVDRDFEFIGNTHHNIKIESFPYKCHGQDKNYAIRHSFMFDYKFGEYLLAPLIDCAGNCWKINTTKIDQVIKDFVMEQMKSLPNDFFPKDGCWYSFAKQLIDQSLPERPYVCHPNPRFRKSQ